MATTVRDPLLSCQRQKRCRRKKFIAALLLIVFCFIMFGSMFMSEKSSRKFHKSLHKLEDRLADLQRSYKNGISVLQKDLSSTKTHFQTAPANQSKDAELQESQFVEMNKALSSLQRQLKDAQEEMEIQREAMKEFLKVFESYKEETNRELSKLRDAHLRDQEEIERLRLEIQQHNGQSAVTDSGRNDSFSQINNNIHSKSTIAPSETKQKTNLVVRSARAVKDYVSNLAVKLNPFRSSRDKTAKPASLVENVRPVEKDQVLAKDLDKILESILSMLNTSNFDDTSVCMKVPQILESKFHDFDLAFEDYTKKNVVSQDRIFKWKKNYLSVKEQLEKIKQENSLHHGSKSHHHHHHHKHGSKQFQKLANMTRHLKDTFQTLLVR